MDAGEIIQYKTIWLGPDPKVPTKNSYVCVDKLTGKQIYLSTGPKNIVKHKTFFDAKLECEDPTGRGMFVPRKIWLDPVRTGKACIRKDQAKLMKNLIYTTVECDLYPNTEFVDYPLKPPQKLTIIQPSSPFPIFLIVIFTIMFFYMGSQLVTQ